MSGGVFAVSRGIFEHELFADEPFTEREAWIWLIGEAAWKAKRVRVGKVAVQLARGQCAFSLRFMASKWKWNEPRVRRFLKRLKSDAMIDVHSDALSTQITICKYNEYQRVSLPRDAASDAHPDADATQTRRKEEDRENIEDRKEKPVGFSAKRASRLPADWTPDEVFAKGEGLSAAEAAREGEKFRDYWLGQPGQKGVKLDWQATWKNWVRKAADDRRGKPGSSNTSDWRKEPEYRGVL